MKPTTTAGFVTLNILACVCLQFVGLCIIIIIIGQTGLEGGN